MIFHNHQKKLQANAYLLSLSSSLFCVHTVDCDCLRRAKNTHALDSPFQGPFRIISRAPLFFTIDYNGHELRVAIERIKADHELPIHFLSEGEILALPDKENSHTDYTDEQQESPENDS